MKRDLKEAENKVLKGIKGLRDRK